MTARNLLPTRRIPRYVHLAAAIGVAFLAPCVVRAQTIEAAVPTKVAFAGRVTDAATGKPLIGAVVSVPDSRRDALTDREGSFRIGGLSAGTYTVEVSDLGYNDLKAEVELTSTGEPVSLSLAPDPVLLEGITVSVDRLESRRRTSPYAVLWLARDVSHDDGRQRD